MPKLVGCLARLSLVWFALGCSSSGPETRAAAGGAAGSATTPAGSGGSSQAGASAQGGSVLVTQSGGAGPSSGGAPAAGGAATSGGSAGVAGSAAGAVVGSGGVAAGGSAGASGGEAGAGAAGGSAAGGNAGGSGAPAAGAGGSASGGTAGGGTAGGGAGGGAGPQTNPLVRLVPAAKEVGLLLAKRFSQQQLAFNSVANLPGDGYKTACEWYGALGVAKLTASEDLLTALVSKFEPLKNNFVSAMTGGDAHVDRYIFGMVPLEIYLQTGQQSYLPLGTQVADKQQTTNQTRNAIDDMFMMTGLQLEAYRATKEAKYIDFMATTMVNYLKAQQPNGLFFHNVDEARVHWARGNGWFAAGMAEMMRDLAPSASQYATIEAGYKKMMSGLLKYQSKNGLWYQVIDMPDNPSNWEESSGSAMFTYAMIAGVRRGILDAATYVPAIEAAWAGLRKKISAQGDVSDICVGTWYKASAQEYMALTRLTGDGHGQAPVLWASAELLR